MPEDFFENARYRNKDGSLREDLMDEFIFPKPKISPELLELGKKIFKELNFKNDDFVNEIAGEVLFKAGANQDEIVSIIQRYGRGKRMRSI